MDIYKKLKSVIFSKEKILLVCFFIVSLAIRIKSLTFESLRNDELWTVWFCSSRYIKSFKEMLHISSSQFIDVPPLYFIIMRIWVHVFGDSEFSIRLPSVIFGSLAILVFYRISKTFFSRRISIISTLILIFIPIHIHYSQEARSYSLFFLLSLCSMFFYIRITNRLTITNIIWYTLFTALSIYCHYFALFLIIAQSIYILYIRKQIKLWALVMLSLLVLLIPLFMYLFHTPVVGTWIQRVSIWRGFKDQLFFFSPYTKLIPLDYIFILIFIVGFIKSLYLLFVKKNNKYLLFIIWFIAPILIPLLISQFTKPFFVARYAIISLTPFIWITAIGIESLLKNKFILLFILLIFISLPFEQNKKRTPSENFENWRKVIKTISTNTSRILVYPNTPATRMAVEFYGEGRQMHLITKEELNGRSKGTCEKTILVLSRYTEFDLNLSCRYSIKKIDTNNPPFLYRFDSLD